MVNKFDSDIETIENELGATCVIMEQLQQDFIAVTAEFIQSWYLKQTESMVRQESDITKQLGVDKLSQLKIDLKSLQENCATIVSKFLNDENLWWHKKRSNQEYGYYGNRPPDIIDKPVRLIAGELAPILEKYGYLSNKLESHGVWREWDKSGNHHPSNARPYYPNAFDWSEKMKAIVKEYFDLKQKGMKMEAKIDKLKEDKKRSEAEDLWKQA